MGHVVLIKAGQEVEVYRYDGDLPVHPGGRKGGRRKNESVDGMHNFFEGGEAVEQPPKQTKARSERSGRAVARAFRRLVAANLSKSDPAVFASFTYRENMDDIRQGRADFAAFARRAGSVFGREFRYIAVAEFQKRGAVHFHALLWGVFPDLVTKERSTRLVAKLWGKGFVDLVMTDSSRKLAGYLAKYMTKTYLDPRLKGMKSYIASRNIKRPYVDRGAILASYMFGGREGIDLSTAVPVHEMEYDTQFYGRANYKRYLILNDHA